MQVGLQQSEVMSGRKLIQIKAWAKALALKMTKELVD